VFPAVEYGLWIADTCCEFAYGAAGSGVDEVGHEHSLVRATASRTLWWGLRSVGGMERADAVGDPAPFEGWGDVSLCSW
jgi:hypothetical protein